MSDGAWYRLATLATAACLLSCSLALELEDTQCQTDKDCKDRGLAGTCIAGLCKDTTIPGPTACETNAECSGDAVCKSSECFKLTTSTCPYVLGADGLKSEAPVLVGAFAEYGVSNPESSVIVKNYELARFLFTDTEEGLPGGPGGVRRPFAFVICNAQQGVDESVTHLVDGVGVAGIIADLQPKDLRRAFETKASSTFLLSPVQVDSTVTGLADNGLIWSLNPTPNALVPVYQPLLAQVEAHLKLAEPIRIALLGETDAKFADLASALEGALKIEGKPITELPSTRYRRLTIDSDPEDPGLTKGKAQTTLLDDLKPHVVVAATGATLAPMLVYLEQIWPIKVGGAGPFYLLSFGHAYDAGLLKAVIGNSPLTSRMLGVNFATNEDLSLYSKYLSEYEAHFSPSANEDYFFYENFYDAAYFMLLAYAGAGNVGDYLGSDVLRGMKRLVDLNGPRVDATREGFSQAMSVLQKSTSGTIALHGTMGPPIFDAEGIRQGKGAVYCIEPTSPVATVKFDVLKLDTTNQTLTGTVPCFSFGGS